MTYFYRSCYKTYEFTAFSEHQLLSQGGLGTNIGSGDSFTMPAHADTCLSVSDNDRYLSGDSCKNENADDGSGQKASITTDGAQAGNGGQIYAESYFWVYDQNGKWYMLIEIEQEGGSGDYFTFHSGYGMPPAGAQLTIASECNVSGDWIDFTCLGAGPKLVPGSVGGRLFEDADGDNTEWNGTTNAWEKGIDGARVELIDAKGNVVATTTTDHYGTYKFENVVPGDHRIKFTNPDGTEFVQKDVGGPGEDSDANADGVTDIFTIDPGEHQWNVDAGVKAIPTGGACLVIEAEDMSEYGFTDVCGGQASGKELVRLDCAGGTGKLWTTFNGADGTYDLKLFAQDENDGNSTIKVLVNGVLVDTIRLDRDSDGAGSDNGGFSEFVIENLQLKAGDQIKLIAYGNCGEYVRIDKIELCKDEEPKLGKIGDKVWFDANRNGIQDTGEAGVANVTVTLLDGTGTVIATTTTDSDGTYLFENLAAGQYQVQFDLPAGGFAFTGQDQGADDASDSDADIATGQTGTITLAAGEQNLTVDAGIVELTGGLSGRYFIDANGDGLDNDGTNGVAGVTVELLDANGVATGITTTTDATGAYSFTGLDAGIYGVTFTDTVTGLPLTTPNAGSDDTIDSDATDLGGGMSRILGIVVNAGQDTPDNDAGVTDPRTGEIGDRVWIDANRNGIQDAGELGLAGVTVTLTGAGADGAFGSGDDTTATTTTGTNGNYLFTGLAAGLYMVEFAQADGFDFTTQDAGADDALDSDAETGTGKTGPITLGQGESNLTVDAGLVKQNGAPTATDDAAKTCADTPVTVDVLANDSDPDGDPLTITHVDGKAISAGGSVTTAAGTVVSLIGGTLVFDGAAAHAELNLGEKGHETIGYTISDGNGGTASADVDLTFCGTVDSVQEFCASLMKTVSYQVDESFFGANASTWDDSGYDIKIVAASGGAAAPLYQGLEFTTAYCLDLGIPVQAGSDFATAPVLAGSVICSADPAVAARFANLDLINWILNQDYENTPTDSIDGKFSGFEVQAAIWSLTDGYDFAADLGKWPVLGQAEDVQKILDDAWDNGQDYDVSTGNIVGMIITPDPITAQNGQPFIVGIEWADFDCLC